MIEVNHSVKNRNGNAVKNIKARMLKGIVYAIWKHAMNCDRIRYSKKADVRGENS